MQRQIDSNGIIIFDDNGKKLLSITESFSDGVMNFSVSGELSSGVSYDFEDELTAAASVCKKIDLDLKGVTYVSAVAFRALIAVQQLVDKDDEATLRICSINRMLLRQFRDNGFDRLFIIDNNILTEGMI